MMMSFFKIESIEIDHLLVDVNGVCYRVFTSTKTLSRSGAEGEAVCIFTEMITRNELPQLYGFHNLAEQDCFRLLTTVQGVGARVALAILSVLDAEELTLAIYNQDKAQISRADGVGAKLALRIISELKDKVAGISIKSGGKQNLASSRHLNPSPTSDAFAALESLGYRRHEVASAIQQAIQHLGSQTTTAEIIRLALAYFSKLKGN